MIIDIIKLNIIIIITVIIKYNYDIQHMLGLMLES